MGAYVRDARSVVIILTDGFTLIGWLSFVLIIVKWMRCVEPFYIFNTVVHRAKVAIDSMPMNEDPKLQIEFKALQTFHNQLTDL